MTTMLKTRPQNPIKILTKCISLLILTGSQILQGQALPSLEQPQQQGK